MKLATKSTCTACMVCIDSCSHQVLSYKIDADGFFEIVADSEKCVNCGLCTKHCPVLNIPPIKNIYLKSYSAWSSNDDLRSKSASGGAFAAIASEFIQKGGVVYGAAIDGLEVRHRRIESLGELSFLQGSKYQPSILTDMYRLVRKDVKSGRLVLFSGLGCQVNGLLSFLGNVLYDNLYTIDNICGGVATMLPMLRLKKDGKYTSILSFRDKEGGWKSKGFQYQLKMRNVKGNVENLSSDNLVIKTFCSKLGKRSSCLDCQFNGVHRASDCTIGDFWGIECTQKEEEKGVSALLVHSKRFSDLLETCEIIMNPVQWTDIAPRNPNLYFSHIPAVRRFISRKILFHALRTENDKLAQKILADSLFSIESKIYNRYIIKQKQLFYSELIK